MKTNSQVDAQQKEVVKEEPVFDGDSVIPGISLAEAEEIRNRALTEAKAVRHTWRQKGTWIHCYSCPHPHGAFIGANVEMVGEHSDGTPIFRPRVMQHLTQTK